MLGLKGLSWADVCDCLAHGELMTKEGVWHNPSLCKMASNSQVSLGLRLHFFALVLAFLVTATVD